MFSRLQRRRSNLQDLGRLSKSCPAVDSPVHTDTDHDKDSDSWGSSSSLSDCPSGAESSDEVTLPVSRAEKQLARQSLRRAKKREMEQKRNLDENRISMDDYLGKQAQFTAWLVEEQKKQAKDLTSPKRKTYFKMFVRLWNKRHLPAKYYESRLSRHMDDENEAGDEKKSPVHTLNRPAFSLIQNSPALDPSIFPHSVDLSSDSMAVGTPSPFTTFGKAAALSSLTPVRFSADSGHPSKDGTVRDKKVLRTDNKENAAHRSLPVYMASLEHQRTATISPHKKMMSTSVFPDSQDRSLDRMVVNWSPRGQPKLNPVHAPRCPSPFHRQIIMDTECTPNTPTMSEYYHEVKDCLDADSPTYVEIPSPGAGLTRDGIYESFENLKPPVGSQQGGGKKTQGRVPRRRSRSMDEAPVYAVPRKNSMERSLMRTPSVPEHQSPTSPPPVPPKRFDPHVEGLGIQFSAPDTAEKMDHDKVQEQRPAGKKEESVALQQSGKKSGGLFKGRLPWFGRKTLMRRRSRSCEAISPLPQYTAHASSNPSHTMKNTDPFPLVEMERSPPLSRRVPARQQKPTDKKADVPEKAEAKFELTQYTSSPMRRLDKQASSVKLELKEYASSPMRLGGGSGGWTPNIHHTPASGLVRGRSVRRRSRSLEHIDSVCNSPLLLPSQTRPSQWRRGPPMHSGAKNGDKPWVTPDEEMPALVQAPQKQEESVSSLNLWDDGQSGKLPDGPCDDQPEDLSSARCEVYEQVKSEAKNSLSSLVRKIQQLSAPDSQASEDEADPMEAEELKCSPKRVGQEVQNRVESVGKSADSSQIESAALSPCQAESAALCLTDIDMPLTVPAEQHEPQMQQVSCTGQEREAASVAAQPVAAAPSASSPVMYKATMAKEASEPTEDSTLRLMDAGQDHISHSEAVRAETLPVVEGPTVGISHDPTDEAVKRNDAEPDFIGGSETAGTSVDKEEQDIKEVDDHKMELTGLTEASSAAYLPLTSKPQPQQPSTFTAQLQQPSTSTAQPSTSTAQPSTSTAQPLTSTAQPSTSTAQPQQPLSSRAQPSPSKLQPQQPLSSTVQPQQSLFSMPQPSTSTTQQHQWEMACHREVVPAPPSSSQVSFSVSVALASGVCESLCPSTGRSSRPLLAGRTQRRRSRSVDETRLPHTITVLKQGTAKPVSSLELPGAASMLTSLVNTPASLLRDSQRNLPGVEAFTSEGLPPPPSDLEDFRDAGSFTCEDLPPPPSDLEVQMSCPWVVTSVSAGLAEKSVVEHSLLTSSGEKDDKKTEKQKGNQTMHTLGPQTLGAALPTVASQPMSVEEQNKVQQPAAKETQDFSKTPKVCPQTKHWFPNTTQDCPKATQDHRVIKDKLQPTPGFAHAVPVQISATPHPKPSPSKRPPPVMAKPALSQPPAPQASQQQQPSPAETILTVAEIQQKFGSTVRAARPSSRRRSRSVGDVSSLNKDTTQGGGFASVRAFWDRVRGGNTGIEKPVTLQRKPSTMKRLQQQLYGKCESGEESNGSTRQDKPTCTPACFQPSAQVHAVQGKQLGQSAQHDEHSVVEGKGSVPCVVQRKFAEGKQSVPFAVQGKSGQYSVEGKLSDIEVKLSGTTPVQHDREDHIVTEAMREMTEKTEDKLPIQRSPYITVRRQSSRKLNTSSPHITAATDSPSSRDDARLDRQALVTGTTTSSLPLQTAGGIGKTSPYTPMQDLKVQQSKESRFPSVQSILSPGRENTKPAVPPKTLPKPTVRPELNRQKNIVVSSPVTVTTGQSPAPSVSRPRKRRSQEQDSTDTPGKFSGPVTKAASHSKPVEGATTLHIEMPGDAQQVKNQDTPRNVRTVKRRSNEKMGSASSFPVKRCNSDKKDEETTIPVSRQNSRKGMVEEGKDLCRGQEYKKNTPLNRRTSKGQESQSHGAVRRQSSGRATPSRTAALRRSSGRVQRSSSGRGTPGTSTHKPARDENNAQILQASTPVQVSISVRQRGKADPLQPVKQTTSTKGGAASSSTPGSVKRLSSMKDDTHSSRTKRRSGVGTAGAKRTSSGGGKVQRQSGRVSRSNNNRQGDSTSRAGSFRRQGGPAPQSPTFLRISHHLGVSDEENSDDTSIDEGTGVVVESCEGVDKHSSGRITRGLSCNTRTRQSQRPLMGSFAQRLEQTLSNSLRNVGVREAPSREADIETDIDCCTDAALQSVEREAVHKEKSCGLSTLV